MSTPDHAPDQAGGSAAGLQSVPTDAVSRLEQSESLLRSVVQNAQRFGIYRILVDSENLYAGKVVLVSPSIADIFGIDDIYRFESWFENLHPDDRTRVVEANHRSLKEGIPYNQPTRFFNKRRNRWCWVHTISNPGFDSQGKLTHFDGIVVDLTEQKEAELALQELNTTLEQRVEERTRELERRREIAESLRDIIRMINSSLPLDAFLDQAVRMASQRLGAEGCILHHFDMDNKMLVHMASYGMEGIYRKGRRNPFDSLRMFGGEFYLQATLERKPIYSNYPPLPDRIDEIEQDSTLPPFIKAERVALRKKFAGSFSVPLYIQDKVYGGMVFYYTEPQEFTEEQIQLGLTFAEQVALAIENAMLREQAAQTAAIAERNRLARDLHDAVSQTLFSASLIADVLPKLWEKKPEVARQKLDELRLLTRGALSEMRTLLLELRPSSLIETDLADLLRHLTNAFAGRTRIPITVNIEGMVDPPFKVKEVIYRIAQESLNNINKHAQASAVMIQLLRSETEIRLEVRDNGRGFDPQDVTLESLGLGIMRERAAAIDAALTIESTIGNGTCIVLRWKDVQND
jgi:PAS domain S-box-containing protein